MPEIKETIKTLADTMTAQFSPPEFHPGCEVKSVADKDEHTTDNGYIEAIVGPHGQQRVRYFGFPPNVGTVNFFVDVEYFPSHQIYQIFNPNQGGTATVGGIKVSELWESDFGAVAWQTDAAGDLANVDGETLTLQETTTAISPQMIVKALGDTSSQRFSTVSLAHSGGDGVRFVGVRDQSVSSGMDFFLYVEPQGASLVPRFIILNDGKIGLGDFSGGVTPQSTVEIREDHPLVFGSSVLGDTTADRSIQWNFNYVTPSVGTGASVRVTRQSGNNDGMYFSIWTEPVGGSVTERFRITEAGHVGIGTTAPAVGPSSIFGMHIKTSANCGLFVDAGAAQTAVYYMGHGGTANWQFQSGSSNDFQIVETGVAVRFTILDSDNGKTMVGTGTPTAQLHVDQSSTTAAIPVLYLDQADISEEMIEFNTTIGTGNAIEAVGAKTLTTTHFIKVTLPGALTRYIPVGTIA